MIFLKEISTSLMNDFLNDLDDLDDLLHILYDTKRCIAGFAICTSNSSFDIIRIILTLCRQVLLTHQKLT